MRQFDFGRVIVVAWVLSAAALTLGQSTPFGAPHDQPPVSAFPDEWFFGGAARPAPLRALEGKTAPELTIDAWIGDEVSVADSRGRVVVIDFWATWCGPCMASIPHNVELVTTYAAQGLVFVGVHDSNAGWNSAQRVVMDKRINYSVGMDKGGESVGAYALQFWPTYVVIDRAGVVRAAGLTPDHVEDVVKVLLAEAAPEAGAVEATDEFEPAFYYGGSARPMSLRTMQGREAPTMKGAEWFGLEPAHGVMDDSVVVLTFVTPGISVSLSELDKLAALQEDLGPQGVVFVAICKGTAAWEPMVEHAKAGELSIPIMRDSVEARKSKSGVEALVSVTADAFGVEFYPTTVVIDRKGTIRAAGVRMTKVRNVVERLLSEAGAGVPASSDDASGKGGS